MKGLLIFVFILPFSLFSQAPGPPVFSHESGFYDEAFRVSITHSDPDVTILYTTDGSAPKIEKLEGEIWSYKKIVSDLSQ